MRAFHCDSHASRAAPHTPPFPISSLSLFASKGCSNPACDKVEPKPVKGQPVTKFAACVACKRCVYCSRECQKAHWTNGHKAPCATEKVRLELLAKAKDEKVAAATSEAAGKGAGGKKGGDDKKKKKGRGKRDKVN